MKQRFIASNLILEAFDECKIIVNQDECIFYSNDPKRY